MKMSLREKIMLLGLFIVAIVYLFYTYLYAPVTAEIKTVYTENQTMKNELELYKNNMKSNSGIDKQWEQLQKDYNELAVKVPDESMLPEVLSFLDQIAAECHVKAENISLQPAAAAAAGTDVEASLQQVKIQLSLRGSYFDLLSYLLKIEKAPRLYRIENAQMIYSPAPAAAPVSVGVEGEEASAVPALPAPVINEIAMSLNLTTFYDNFSLPGFKAELEKVQPGAGKDNPFGI